MKEWGKDSSFLVGRGSLIGDRQRGKGNRMKGEWTRSGQRDPLSVGSLAKSLPDRIGRKEIKR